MWKKDSILHRHYSRKKLTEEIKLKKNGTFKLKRINFPAGEDNASLYWDLAFWESPKEPEKLQITENLS